MWVQRGGPPDTPVIHFRYDLSRATDVVSKLLDGFAGVVMSDGYEPCRKVAACLLYTSPSPRDRG